MAVFIIAWALPQEALAFWSLFSKTQAAEEAPEIALHSSTKVAVLEAATNPDPNPNKGGLDIGISEGSALIPSSGPEGTLPENLAIGGPVSDAISLYTVREGDSLSAIADMHGVSVNTIKWANSIKDVSLIRPGDTLLILPVSGVKYTVKSGGTLRDIAKIYNVDVEEIALFNGIDPEARLAAGTDIIVPGAHAPSEKKVVARSSGAVKVVAAPLPELSGYFGTPIAAGKITQGIHGNNGVDVGAPAGTAIYSAADGTVIAAGNGSCGSGYGICAIVTHANGAQTLYAHMSSISVVKGQQVTKGEMLGGVGSTGRSTGNHLHFEVRGAKNPLAN